MRAGDRARGSTKQGSECAVLSEVAQLQEYRRQLASMLPYVSPGIKAQLQAEIAVVEQEITDRGPSHVTTVNLQRR